ncbi:DUF4160 domain-containing protein [Hydrogenimonas sp.]
MPSVLRIGAYRFFFYSNEWGEPPHIHIQSGKKLAKFWLDPVQLAKSKRFSALELKKLERLVEEHRELFWERWHEYFSNA